MAIAFNNSFNSALIQQQIADQQKAREWMSRIGYIPQGGPRVTHGDVNRAVNIGGLKTSIEEAPGNMMTATFGGPPWLQGLGIDLDGNGKFEHGKDGHLALDIDGDGTYSRQDMQDTLDMLRIFSGAGADVSGPGGFNQPHQAKLLLLQARGKQADLNQDGVLSSWELARMGGKVVVDEPRQIQGPVDPDGPLVARDFSPNLVAHDLPGSNIPDYQPRPQFPHFGYPPFGGYNFGSPAFFSHFMHNMISMMSFFARPF